MVAEGERSQEDLRDMPLENETKKMERGEVKVKTLSRVLTLRPHGL